MAFFTSGCDHCGSNRTNDGLMLHLSPYKYHHGWGSAKVFCSNRCLDNYKEKLGRDKELINQKKKEENELKKIKIEEEREKEREESRARAQKARDELKKDLIDVADLIINSHRKQTKNRGCLEQLWIYIIVLIIIMVLISNIFNIDGSKFLKFFFGGFH